MIIGWGTLLVCSHFGISLSQSAWWLYIPFMLGGLSPTISSYVVLKKHKQVSGFKEWLKNIFLIKVRPVYYIFTIAMVALYFIVLVFFSDIVEINPFYMFFTMLPVMLVGGGMEEAGWRYILQPGLDKKLGFILSSMITAIIWFAWHIPLFFIPGTGQAENMDIWMFAIVVLGMSFSFGAIRKITGSVFLAVLAHTMTNAGYVVFNLSFTWKGTIITALTLITVSIGSVLFHNKKQKSSVV